MTKTILITGASGNLGKASVQRMLDRNYTVIAVGSHTSDMQFAKDNANYESRAVNLTNEEETNLFVENIISKYTKIDAAFLLVGGFSMGNMKSTGGEQLRKMYSLNFETAYYTARPVFEHMLKNGIGRIVLIGARPSLEARQGKNMIAYALSKSLLLTMADIMNEESNGINVVTSVVIPGIIDTPLNRQEMPDANYSSWVSPEQVAGILEFTCSDAGMAIREPIYKVYNNA